MAGPNQVTSFFAELRTYWNHPHMILGIMLVGYSVTLVAEIQLVYLLCAVLALALKPEGPGLQSVLGYKSPNRTAQIFSAGAALLLLWMLVRSMFDPTSFFSWHAARNLTGMIALWVWIRFLLCTPWRKQTVPAAAVDTFIAATTIAMAISLVCYFTVSSDIFVFPERRMANMLMYWGGLAPVLTGLLAGFAGVALACRWPSFPRRRLAAVALVVLVAACLFSQSRGAIVSFLGAFVILFVLRPRQTLYPLLITVVVAVFYQYASPKRTIYKAPRFSNTSPVARLVKRSHGGRKPLYHVLVRRMDSHEWLIGKGPNADHVVTRPEIHWHAAHPHSAYLATVYHGGFVALIILLATAAWGWWQCFLVFRRKGDPLWFCLAAFGGIAMLPDGESFVSLWTLPRLEGLIFWFPLAAGVAAMTDFSKPSTHETT